MRTIPQHSELDDFVRQNRHGGLVLTTPDVFPSESIGHDLEGIHDIIGGHVPAPVSLSERNAFSDGWLRFTLPGKDSPSYTDPALPLATRRDLSLATRPTQTEPIVVERSWLVHRTATDVPKTVQHIYFDAQGAYLGVDQSETQRRVESAVLFAGRISVGQESDEPYKRIHGVHFRSGHILGWVRILPR